MGKLKNFLADRFSKILKAFKLPEVLRFKILYWGYRLFSNIHTRDKEWDFVLNYLPPVGKSNHIKLLDVGASGSLFLHILARRGYEVSGVDVRPYQERLPDGVRYFQCEIRDIPLSIESFDYITMVSVIQHVGSGEYGGPAYKNGDRIALKELSKFLKSGGKLLITTFTDVFVRRYDGKVSFKGYSYLEFKNLVEEFFFIQECIERKGVICAALVKK